MAFQTLIPQAVRPAGISRGSARVVPGGVQRITLQISGPWQASDDMALLGVEYSPDGVTWGHYASIVAIGGARGPGGVLPSLTMLNPPAGQYRGVCILASGTTFGVDVEVV